MRKYLRAAVVVGLVSVPLMPLAFYGFFAYVRQEHFYHGLPTSYWRLVIRHWDPNASDSSEPSAIPYLDTVLAHIGCGDEPGVLSGDRAAIPVLMDLIWCEEPAVASHASASLAGIALGAAPMPDAFSYAEIAVHRRGSASATSIQRGLDRAIMLSVSSQPAAYTPEIGHNDSTRYDFILIDSQARYLDTLHCSFFKQYCSTSPPTFRVEAVEPGQFAIRYFPGVDQSDTDPDPSEPIDRNIVHERRCTNDLVTKPEWQADALCRFAIHGDKFVVLHPALTASTIQWRWKDEDMPAEAVSGDTEPKDIVSPEQPR